MHVDMPLATLHARSRPVFRFTRSGAPPSADDSLSLHIGISACLHVLGCVRPCNAGKGVRPIREQVHLHRVVSQRARTKSDSLPGSYPVKFSSLPSRSGGRPGPGSTRSSPSTRASVLPTHSRAAILQERNQPLVLAQIELPATLDAGQVLVEVLYSAICGSQLREIDGTEGKDQPLPRLLGHEGVGRVLEVGAGVQHVKQGDTVVMHWRQGRGMEATAPKYVWDGWAVSGGCVTTFNEYAVVSENRL